MPLATQVPIHHLDSARPPVVLMGGLNLTRTLGLAGLQVIVASPDRNEPAFRSRYCVGRCYLPPFDQGIAAVDALVSLGDLLAGAYGRRVPLMYGSDEALGLLYSHRDRLERYFLFLVADRHVGDALISKDRFQALGAERGLPVPSALQWEGAGPGTLAGTQGPVLIKPRIKVDWHHSVLCARLFNGDGKARVFASGAEVLANAAVGMYREQLAFQEYIPGGDIDHWSYHGFADERGEVLAEFIGRKVRTYPVTTGESAFIELARDEALAAIGRDVARRCPLKGIFKMDFKHDEHTGTWRLLEINARFNLWHYLGAVNGANLMRTAYDFLVSGTRPEAPTTYATRYRWLALSLDWRAFRELRSQGQLSAFRWAASIALSRNVYNVFAWNDLAPWAFFWASRASRRLTQGVDRINSALRQWLSTAS